MDRLNEVAVSPDKSSYELQPGSVIQIICNESYALDNDTAVTCISLSILDPPVLPKCVRELLLFLLFLLTYAVMSRGVKLYYNPLSYPREYVTFTFVLLCSTSCFIKSRVVR